MKHCGGECGGLNGGVEGGGGETRGGGEGGQVVRDRRDFCLYLRLINRYAISGGSAE